VPGLVTPASRRALLAWGADPPGTPRWPTARFLRHRAGALAVAVLAVTAALTATGCSTGRPGTSQGTVANCYAFAVHALNQHVTVTSVPAACAGLTHEQINLAVDRAIRAVVGPHRKAVARRLAHREGAYLSYLVTVVPPRAPAPQAATPATPSSRLPLELAALAAWAVTAAAGTWLLAGWIARGGLRRGYARVAGVPRAVIVGHFTLALTGLGIWIAFLATSVAALAWAAVAVVLSVAGLGMATLAGGLPEQRRPGDGPPEQHRPGDGPPEQHRPSDGLLEPQPATTANPVSAGAVAGATVRNVGSAQARTAAIVVPAGKPLAVIVLHGALASATILLVVLAAIGAG